MGVLGMRVSAGPHFMKKERSGRFHGAVQIECEAAFFSS